MTNKPNPVRKICFGRARLVFNPDHITWKVFSPSELIANPDVVLPELEAGSADEAIATLHARLSAASPAVKDAPQFLAELLQRSRLASVAIALDVAVPHARTDAVERVVLALGRSKDGVAFDAAHPRVRLIFLIGTPRQPVGEYLRLVATLARILRNEGVRQAMLNAGGEDELRGLLGHTINVGI